MGWKISDILALLVTLFVSLNILISVISLSGKHLERRMDMEHLSLFFKMVLVFSAFGMPVLAGVNSFLGKEFIWSVMICFIWIPFTKVQLATEHLGEITGYLCCFFSPGF